MIIAFLFALSAVTVNCESFEQDGLRKSRQLDLDLQDIEASTTVHPPLSQKESVINGYLPPISSSLTPEAVSAQSQLAIDVRLSNSLEKKSNLCRPPYDHESCNIKDTSISNYKVKKPSRDLMPPFVDVEPGLEDKGTTLLEPAKEETKPTAQSRTPATVTPKPTSKLMTKIFKPSSSRNFARIIRPTARSTAKLKPAGNAVEATNELRSYLPPQSEISAAAQTNVAVVQSAIQNNQARDDDDDHHHHHGHHQDENFNICDDAFHAFLCAPLKARKRITGAFPASLLASSSYINYQKSFSNSDRDYASSNTFRNEYLPPKLSPTNFVHSTYSPPLTSKIPTTVTITTTTTTTTTPQPYSTSRIIPQSSNTDDQHYLPPLTDNRIFNSSLINPAPSIQSFTAVKPLKTEVSTALSTPGETVPAVLQTLSPTVVPPTAPVLNSVSSNENVFYSYPSPSVPFFPSTSVISTLPPVTSTFVPFSSVTNEALSPFNSNFEPQKPKVVPTLPVITEEEKKRLHSTLTPFVQVPSFAPQPSILNNSYLPPKSEVPAHFNPISTNIKPTTFHFVQQSSNTDQAYLPPDPKEPAAAQISSAAVSPPQDQNPSHIGKDPCTDPFHSFLCANAKPRKRITGQSPSGFNPNSPNANESRVKPESSNQDESRVKPPEETSAQNIGYTYPRPSTFLPTPSTFITTSVPPSTGYFYPKPDKIFPLPSQQDVKIAHVLLSTSTNPEPTLRPNAAELVTGYLYPKPDKIFSSPAGLSNTKITSTTISPSTGYSYQKPLKPFPLPTEQQEIRQKPKTQSSPQSILPLSTNENKGYQYPKPEENLKLPEKKGYSYPKPDKRLELPSENRSKKLPQSKSNLEVLGNLGSADFIPVNKVDIKRAESSKLLTGLRRFGERMKKRERELQLYKKRTH